MYIYYNKPSFTLGFGPFLAKCGAICRQLECVLVQNRVRFGTKWSAFWCKTQGKMVLIAVQNAAKCETIKHKHAMQWYK